MLNNESVTPFEMHYQETENKSLIIAAPFYCNMKNFNYITETERMRKSKDDRFGVCLFHTIFYVFLLKIQKVFHQKIATMSWLGNVCLMRTLVHDWCVCHNYVCPECRGKLFEFGKNRIKKWYDMYLRKMSLVK